VKLTQKTFLQTAQFVITASALVVHKKSIIYSSTGVYPFDEILIDSKRTRKHLDGLVFAIVIFACLGAIILLLTRFRIFTNVDLFVVLCGLILIMTVGFRILQSHLKIQIVIPTRKAEEIVLEVASPNVEAVDAFMVALITSMIQYHQHEKIME
jgi:hypothetical protein